MGDDIALAKGVKKDEVVGLVGSTAAEKRWVPEVLDFRITPPADEIEAGEDGSNDAKSKEAEAVEAEVVKFVTAGREADALRNQRQSVSAYLERWTQSPRNGR